MPDLYRRKKETGTRRVEESGSEWLRQRQDPDCLKSLSGCSLEIVRSDAFNNPPDCDAPVVD